MFIPKIQLIVRKIEPLIKEISKTTNIWSLIFVTTMLILNLMPLSHTNAVFYYAHEELNFGNKGGPISIEADPSLQSGLGVSPTYTTDLRRVFVDNESATAIATSNPTPDFSASENGIKQYKVKKGDTIAKIAIKFNISADTIKFANGGIKAVKVGQVLSILPVSGVLYTVKEGDILEGVAKKYSTEIDSIKRYNPNYQKIMADGSGSLILPAVKPTAKISAEQTTAKLQELKNFFTLPLAGMNFGELHDVNAVDIGNKCGIAVKASAGGMVIEDSTLKSDGSTGWNNGYGLFVLIEHSNGVRTRYAHLSKALVKVGDSVTQGEQIGLVGSTGNADGPTGCHLHFEVLGVKNPFANK